MPKVILVAGATGYVAARLIPELLDRGFHVRCLVRSPEKIRHRSWYDRVELCQGDVLDEKSLYSALSDVQVAYYLVHNMSSGKNYRENERTGAMNFGKVAKVCGLEQIIFLGGLGGSDKTRHMKSRQETGKILRESGVPVTEFRSSVIIGSGSISFELIRFLTMWFPLIPAPKQTNQWGQPIGIRDLLHYLTLAMELPESRGRIIEIGGIDRLRYPELMSGFALAMGLFRPRLALPLFPIALSARIADLLTPVPNNIAFPLMEELTSSSIVQNSLADEIFPSMELSRYAESVQNALSRKEYPTRTGWLGALVTREPLKGDHVRTSGEGLLIDYRELDNREHQINPKDFHTSKSVDGWITVDKGSGDWIGFYRKLKLLGSVRVEFWDKGPEIIQLLMFEPRGIPGLLWWKLVFPFVSRWMLAKLRREIGS